jgi:hypothetical protein
MGNYSGKRPDHFCRCGAIDLATILVSRDFSQMGGGTLNILLSNAR